MRFKPSRVANCAWVRPRRSLCFRSSRPVTIRIDATPCSTMDQHTRESPCPRDMLSPREPSQNPRANVSARIGIRGSAAARAVDPPRAERWRYTRDVKQTVQARIARDRAYRREPSNPRCCLDVIAQNRRGRRQHRRRADIRRLRAAGHFAQVQISIRRAMRWLGSPWRRHTRE